MCSYFKEMQNRQDHHLEHPHQESERVPKPVWITCVDLMSHCIQLNGQRELWCQLCSSGTNTKLR